ncbi:MAG: NHL repeat-containing protein [Planctomycetota bacterium]
MSTSTLCRAQRAAAPPTKATHKEVRVIGRTDETRFGRLATICLAADGKLLAADSSRRQIKVFSAEGKLLKTWKPPLAPSALHAAADGTVYVGGTGKLAKLDAAGKVLKTVSHEEGGFPRSKVSGLTLAGKDLFASFGRGWSLRSTAVIVRFDADLGAAKTIATGLRGCCQRLDLVSRDGVLYVAENTRHRVVRYDREGKVLSKWGRRDRKKVDGFGSCCNPMNLCFGPGGVLYTAESGLGRIKRYTADGKFLGLVGYVELPRSQRAGRLAASCSNIAVAVSRDGSRVYVQDYKGNVIRVLAGAPQVKLAKSATDRKPR